MAALGQLLSGAVALGPNRAGHNPGSCGWGQERGAGLSPACQGHSGPPGLCSVVFLLHFGGCRVKITTSQSVAQEKCGLLAVGRLCRHCSPGGGCGLPCRSVNMGVCTGRETGVWGGEPRSPFCGVAPRRGCCWLGKSPLAVVCHPGSSAHSQETLPWVFTGKGGTCCSPTPASASCHSHPAAVTHTLPVGTARGVPGTPQHRPAPAAAVPSPVLGWTSGFVLSACCTCCQRGPSSARLSQAPAVVLLLLDVGTHVRVMWRCGVCAQELPPCPPNGSGDRRVCQLPPAGPWAPGSWWRGGVPPSAVGQRSGAPGLPRERPMGVGCFTSPHLGSGCREGLTKRL